MTTTRTANRRAEIAKAVGRYALEAVVALLLLVFAAETWTHRQFSPDPHYRFVIEALALWIAGLGLVPLAHHLSPRLGKLALLVCTSLLTLLVIAAQLTR